jgi:UDP-N-acetyl-D-mannosaminuronic acid dehydrogenase
VGGHCISVDPWFFVEAAPDLTPLIHTARQVNDAQPHFVVDLVNRCLGGPVKGRKITVLGLSYKADVDDMRESPAIDVAQLLCKAGADLRSFDPFYKEHMGLKEINPTNDIKTALDGTELIALLVAHSVFKEMLPGQLAGMTPARLIVDTVHTWTQPDWVQAGFKMVTLGVG